MIYLDNAATTFPKPPQVREAMLRSFRELGANPGRGGYGMALRTTQAVYDCRAALAEFFGAPGPECVTFQPSCTQALNLVIQGALNPGDHVVISDLEHNAVLRPLTALADKDIAFTIADTVPGDNTATLDAFRRALRPNTRLVVCTQGSNVWGFRLPVERLAALCHPYGIKLCVDAAQTAGVVPIHLGDSGVDYLCCAGHKGLYGPMGTGLLIFRDSSDRLRPLIQGGTGTQSQSPVQPEDPPERYESGTLNLPGIAGLRAGLEFVRRRDPEALWRQELALTARLYDQLSRIPRVKLYTPRPELPWALPVLSFNIDGLSSEEAGNRLGQAGFAVRAGLHCAPLAHGKLGTGESGTVRAAPSAFTRREEIDAFARQVRLLAGK